MVGAHNMGFDVRITQAIPELQRLEWQLQRWQVSDQGCVIRWRKGDRALWLWDTHSLISKSLAEIGGLVNLQKRELPSNDDDPEYWWGRCEMDVEILRAAMLPLVKWIREDDLGNWQATAGSQAWANWRHRHYTHPVLVHDDQDARDAERSAGYTGRCEAWRHGRLPFECWTEWDFPLAYPRVCLDTAMPAILRGRIIEPKLSTVVDGDDRNRYLVFADVRTEVPTLPHRKDNRILWPVGNFEGWYWDHELKLAAENGARIRPQTAYRYSASHALAQWAESIIDMVESRDGRFTMLQQAAAKAWARALIGRFGVRYWAWEDWGDEDDQGVRMDWLVDYDTRNVGRQLHVAGKLFGAFDMTDGVNAVPAIMSAVMSECRIRLWSLMTQAGLENVAYVDTDSAIVSEAGSEALYHAGLSGTIWEARPKSEWHHIQVLAPRQLILDNHHRVSGVSRGATQVSPIEWVGERWEGLSAAVDGGRHTEVVVRPTKWQLTGMDNRRRHLEDGSTLAFAVTAP
jgi:hypothetical protein